MKLKLNRESKGIYTNQVGDLIVDLSNPKLSNGFGNNFWELIITYKEEEIYHETFSTKYQALESGGWWIENELENFI